MKTRKFLLAATAALTALLFGLTSCEDKGGNGGLTLSPNYVTVAPGETETVTLNSDGVAVDAASVTWTSNNTDIFTIENGVITGVAVGHGTFTATYNNSSVTGDVVVEEEAPEAPPTADLLAPEGGLVIAVYIPEGSDCNGIVAKSGNLTDNPEYTMTAVEGFPRWYQVRIPTATEDPTKGVDFAGGNAWEGKVCALPQQDGKVDTNWTTQWNVNGLTILEGSAASAKFVLDYDTENKLQVTESGYVYVQIAAWNTNPCETDREYTFTVVVPECTPEGQATVNVTGGFDEDPDTEDVQSWGNGIDFPITDGKATITITGQGTTEWKVRLNGGSWTEQAVHCATNEETMESSIAADENRNLGDAEGQEIVIEGWGDTGVAIEGCLTDCVVAAE